MPGKYKSSASIISVEEAVGKVLAHDITEIRPGEFKGPAFRKGHIISVEDVEHLKRLGKEHIFVLHLSPGEIHEDEAALRLVKALCGEGVRFETPPAEGKIAVKAARRGLLHVKVEALTAFNVCEDVTCSTRHTNTLVEEGETLAATRAIPLIIDEKTLEKAVAVAREAGGIISVRPMAHPKTDLVITGSEVYKGRIDDKFAPIIRKKASDYQFDLRNITFVPDDKERISGAIGESLDAGVEFLLVAGGMSVDPDDVTRMAIADAGAEDVVYGTPVLPGAMFLYGRFGDVPVLGLPACVLFYRATVLDLVLPRVLAGDRITRRDLAELAHGGYCLNCTSCRYPVCPFGK